MFLTNAYVIYFKTCDEFGIPKLRRMTHLEFQKVILLAWKNTEVHADEWKAKEAASRTNNTFSVIKINRVGDNEAVSLMTMDSSFLSSNSCQYTRSPEKNTRLNDISLRKDGHHSFRLDILLDHLPVKKSSTKIICALHYLVEVETQKNVMFCPT